MDTQQWIVPIQFHSNFFPSGIRDLSSCLCREVPPPLFPIPQPMWASPQACADVKVSQGQGDALEALQRKHPKTLLDTYFLLLWSTLAVLVYPIKAPSPEAFGFSRWAQLEAPTNFCGGVGKDTNFLCVFFQTVGMLEGRTMSLKDMKTQTYPSVNCLQCSQRFLQVILNCIL